jgi:hypothetical protein
MHFYCKTTADFMHRLMQNCCKTTAELLQIFGAETCFFELQDTTSVRTSPDQPIFAERLAVEASNAMAI